MFVRDVCLHATKKVVTIPSRVSTSTNNSTGTKNTTLVPMDVSQMISDISKSKVEGQESDSCQYEQDQDCDGDELFAVKGKGKGGFKETCFKCGMRGHKADRCWQKGTGKGGKGDWEKAKREIQRERDGPRESGQVQVTRGTILGIIPLARQGVWS